MIFNVDLYYQRSGKVSDHWVKRLHSSEEINTPTPSRTYLPTLISIQCKLGRLLTHCSKGTLKPPHTMKCGPKAYLVSYNIPNTNIDIDVKLWADFRDWDMLMRNLIRLTVHSRTPGVDLSFLQIILMNYQSEQRNRIWTKLFMSLNYTQNNC